MTFLSHTSCSSGFVQDFLDQCRHIDVVMGIGWDFIIDDRLELVGKTDR